MTTPHHPRSHYDPRTARLLDVINRIALFDETERAITYPNPAAPDPAATKLLEELQAATGPGSDAPGQHPPVWSFDIDLTLRMPDDHPGCRGPIPINRLVRLQRQGAIVGTCSDREPSEQRSAMTSQGFTPDFCIPKEMLPHLASLGPAAVLTHVGDDPRRDRDVAVMSGWRHRWPTRQPAREKVST